MARKVRQRRQLPNVKELIPLMRFGKPELDRRHARLQKAADVYDLRAIAKRRTPKPAFDYVDGAAVDEITKDRTREAFDEVEFIPTMLNGHGSIDLGTTIAGGQAALPIGIAPTGFTRFMHTEGEDAGAGAATTFDIPFSLSTMGTRSLEEVAARSGKGRRWFQLYLWKDREASANLLQRAKSNGFDTLLVTIDTAVAGQRLRDVRNGMKIPPELSLKTVLDASYRPEWWFNFLTTDSLKFASLSDTSSDLPSLVNAMFDPTLSYEDLAWIREHWDGKLFVKGVLNPEDAIKIIATGADGLVVSSHGGRQLDRAPVPLQQLPKIRDAVGNDVEIIYDSGVMSGNDVAIALALGADFVLIGRAYLYGLMAGGQEGVERVLELMARELDVTLHLLGVSSVRELDRSMVQAPWLES
ncbi:MAG: alpha-hydroxy acid oxidase [Corynebacterium sp.]|nr:alpha-hydroxy acid oxidase [Corynebacterium sp.]